MPLPSRHAGSWCLRVCLALMSIGTWTRVSGAAEGLYLTWNGCATSSSATSNASFTCDTDAGSRTLFASFTLPAAVDNVIAARLVIDLQHSESTLPAWWRYAPGDCRFGFLKVSGEFGGQPECVDFWTGDAGIISPPTYNAGFPRGASTARIIVTAQVPSSSPRTLASTTATYHAAKMVFEFGKTTGAQACTGCTTPVCLVLESVELGRVPGSVPEVVTLQTPGPGNANWATWQGGAGASCAAVPVRAATWGRLKSLYR